MLKIIIIFCLNWSASIQFYVNIYFLFLFLFRKPSEIIRFPNFTNLVKPASHCPYYHLLETMTASCCRHDFNGYFIVLTMVLIYLYHIGTMMV